jgi:hypothetical protein
MAANVAPVRTRRQRVWLRVLLPNALVVIGAPLIELWSWNHLPGFRDLGYVLGLGFLSSVHVLRDLVLREDRQGSTRSHRHEGRHRRDGHRAVSGSALLGRLLQQRRKHKQARRRTAR